MNEIFTGDELVEKQETETSSFFLQFAKTFSRWMSIEYALYSLYASVTGKSEEFNFLNRTFKGKGKGKYQGKLWIVSEYIKKADTDPDLNGIWENKAVPALIEGSNTRNDLAHSGISIELSALGVRKAFIRSTKFKDTKYYENDLKSIHEKFYWLACKIYGFRDELERHRRGIKLEKNDWWDL